MSANTRAPSTIVTIALSGQTEFTIPFEYLARKYVEVTLLGIDRLPLVLNTDFRFVNKTLISLTQPYTSEYQQIELRRVTSATERLVDFHDGSILRSYDLNLSQIQTLHVAEEARDLTADTIGVNDEGHLDARNRRIVNLADAVNGRDAITLGQVIQWNDSAFNSAERAEASAATASAANQAANNAKDIAVSSAQQTLLDSTQTQADAVITTQNAILTAADRAAAADILAQVEAASGPSQALVAQVNQASTDASEAKAAASLATPKVLDISNVLRAQAGWTLNSNECAAIEFPNHYQVTGIARRSSPSQEENQIFAVTARNCSKISFAAAVGSSYRPGFIRGQESAQPSGLSVMASGFTSAAISWVIFDIILIK